MTETTATTRITRVGLVGIPVSDPDRALEFYTGTLGFDKRLDVPFGDGARWIEVVPPGAHTGIALVPVGSGQQPGIRLVTEDADADHAFLRARGADTDPEVTRLAPPVPPMFAVRDPDGNVLLIVKDH
jgi:catechol 2,3-dioxygenase-like lactoylglutathione lyase family enzyme